MKNFFRTLFSDRSFWAAIISLAGCIGVAANVPQGSIEQITTILGAVGTFIAYIINNGIQTAAAIKAQAQVDIVNAQLRAAHPELKK